MFNIDFISESVPDATTLLKFRHLLEKRNIGEMIFADINTLLAKLRKRVTGKQGISFL